MAKRAIKLQASADMDELSDAPAAVDTIERPLVSEPVMATPIVSSPPTVQGAPVTPASDKPASPKKKNVDTERAEIFARAKECGVADGKGKKAFVQFARTLVDGGVSGALSTSSKAGDASKIYNEFIGASATAAGDVTDEQKASQASQIAVPEHPR